MPVINSSSLSIRNPRILYDDIFRRGTVAADSELGNFVAENVADGLTYDFWKPATQPSRIEVQLSASEQVDCAALVHTLGTCFCGVKFQYHNGSIWVDLTSQIFPTSDNVLMFFFGQVTASRFGFLISGDNSPVEIPAITVAAAGKALAVERGVTLNHRPITLQRRTTFLNNMSEGGQRLGLSIVREGVETNVAFKYLDVDWYRTYFDPFVDHVRTEPFFMAWSPQDNPEDAAYLWLPPGKEDIRPEHADLQDRFHVAFDVEGIAK